MGAFEGKVAVVSGGASGFGLGIATRFVEEGADVVIADRNEVRLDAEARRIGALGVRCDVTDFEQVAALAETAVKRFGHLDVAVNSAGFAETSTVREITPEKLEPMAAVQFFGAVYFLSHMANRMGPGGSVVMISSTTGTLVAENYGPYAASKAAVNHMVRIAACEYGPDGIRVNAVAPTVIDTPMTHHMFENPGHVGAVLEETPLGRLGAIDDVVDTVTWLASDAASFITGQLIHVDGGGTLRRLPLAEQLLRHERAAAATGTDSGRADIGRVESLSASRSTRGEDER